MAFCVSVLQRYLLEDIAKALPCMQRLPEVGSLSAAACATKMPHETGRWDDEVLKGAQREGTHEF
jgi:hypothetical protein